MGIVHTRKQGLNLPDMFVASASATFRITNTFMVKRKDKRHPMGENPDDGDWFRWGSP